MAPARTSRTPAKSSMLMKTPLSKKSKQPNGSILSFFKKVDAPDDPMFVDSGAGPFPLPQLFDQDENGDLYGYDGKGADAEERRYNEFGSPVKRRRLSGTDKKENGAPNSGSLLHPSSPSAKPRPQKPPIRGPFLDDSDSEEDEDGPRTLPREPVKEVLILGKDEDPIAPRPRPEMTGGGPRPNPPPRHLADDPPPLKHEESTSGDFGGFSDLDQFDDEDFDGEEFRMMKYMEEQARLEAEAEAEAQAAATSEPGSDSGVETDTVQGDSAMEERCPICSASLAGTTAEQATVHVNACLDGRLIPPPKTTAAVAAPPPRSLPIAIRRGEDAEDLSSVGAPEVSMRFARAAVPRPGQANPISLSGGSASGGPNGKSGSAGAGSAFSKLMAGHAEDEAWATAAAAEHASRGKPAYRRTCPFYKIMPGFFICVDAFRYGAVEGCRAYFLSHFHSDHYVGLTANWTHGPIYCSKVTGSLVRSQLRTAAKYVVELEFEETVPVPGTEGVSVTMIPANHCPGSSLFLFEKTIGNGDPGAHAGSGPRVQRILHCGDFRACPAHICHSKLRPETVDAISGKTKQQKIDVCYLDTTYLNPRYSFPSQNDVIHSCADLCALLNKGLMEDDETEWSRVLARREGGGAGQNDTVIRFFKAENRKKSSSSSSGVGSGSGSGSGSLTGDRKSSCSSNSMNTPEPSVQMPANRAAEAAQPDAFAAIRAKQHANRNRLLVVCGTYSIGKERVCKAIAQALKTKIFASPAKIRICQQLGDAELAALMTSDPREAQVHLQMLMEIRAETLAEYLDSYRPYFGRVVGFRPSGWNYRPALASGNGSAGGPGLPGGVPGGKAAAAVAVNAKLPPGNLPTTQLLHGAGWRTRFTARDLVPQRGSTRDAACFGVPYSEHSSFRELALFLMSLRVERVVPTVNVGSEPSRRRMKGWIDRWLSERRRGGVIRLLEEGEEDEEDEEDEGENNVHAGERKKGEKKEPRLWDGKDGQGGGVYW